MIEGMERFCCLDRCVPRRRSHNASALDNKYRYVDGDPISLTDAGGTTPTPPQAAVASVAFVTGRAAGEIVAQTADFVHQVVTTADRQKSLETIASACSSGVPGACDAARLLDEQIKRDDIGGLVATGAQVTTRARDLVKKGRDLFDPKRWRPPKWGPPGSYRDTSHDRTWCRW
jgi:hypothetical protein